MATPRRAQTDEQVFSGYDPDADPMVRNGAEQQPASDEGEQTRTDECAEGGRYEVGGKIVDANGKPIESDGD